MNKVLKGVPVRISSQSHSSQSDSSQSLFLQPLFLQSQRLSGICLVVVFWSLFLLASEGRAESASDRLKIIELFTSHGCSSCPPADRLLGELLAADPELLALEFHVDYWNSLVHGSAGNFVDPYSSPAFSMRQREYNVANLAGRPGVYTPQAVINGRVAAVGSNRRQIMRALNRDIRQALDIQIIPSPEADKLSVELRSLDPAASDLQGIDVKAVSFIDMVTTHITGGENQNLVLDNHHVVTEVVNIGAISKADIQVFSIPRPKPGEGCLVLVQEGSMTPIYAASVCP